MGKSFSSLVRLGFLAIFFIFLFYPDRFQLSFQYPGAPLADSFYVRLAKSVFWILVLIETLRIFYYGIVKTKAKGLVANIFTLLFPVAWLFIVLEMIFMFVPQSHEGVLSKASQIWWNTYWKPTNELGYRDRSIEEDTTKTNVLVIGDSFAAGHGLKSTEERFSDLLEQKLGPDRYRVYNLGVSGSDTRDEAQRLAAYPVKPDVVILQYFPNDIERAGREGGLSLRGSEPYADLSGPLATLVKRFYLPNFIYWQLPHTSFSTFETFVQSAYGDSTILATHLADIQKIVSYADSNQAELYAVFVPFLFQLEQSAGYTKPVEDYLTTRNAKVITLTKGIAAIPEKERIVGKADGHAGAAVNRLMAEEVHKAMKP